MTLYGYIRTSKDGAAGSDPETQRLQLLGVGVGPKNIFADVGTSGTVRVASRNGWRAVASKVDQGDTLVVAALDRIGRRSLDIQGAILDLNRRASGYVPWRRINSSSPSTWTRIPTRRRRLSVLSWWPLLACSPRWSETPSAGALRRGWSGRSLRGGRVAGPQS